MELVEGRSLEQVVDEDGPLPPRLVAEIGADLLGALRTAHASDILHRDVKPSNVLITHSGRVVLTDFGIAKSRGDSALTQTGMVIGSLATPRLSGHGATTPAPSPTCGRWARRSTTRSRPAPPMSGARSPRPSRR